MIVFSNEGQTYVPSVHSLKRYSSRANPGHGETDRDAVEAMRQSVARAKRITTARARKLLRNRDFFGGTLLYDEEDRVLYVTDRRAGSETDRVIITVYRVR